MRVDDLLEQVDFERSPDAVLYVCQCPLPKMINITMTQMKSVLMLDGWNVTTSWRMHGMSRSRHLFGPQGYAHHSTLCSLLPGAYVSRGFIPYLLN